MASVTTRDHDEIQRWAEAHAATPSVVSRTGGMLRFEFAPNPPAELANVSWDDFFRVFDERGLELVYDDKPGSRFHKLIYPETESGAKPVRRSPRASLQPLKTKAKPKQHAKASASSKSKSKTPLRHRRKAA